MIGLGLLLYGIATAAIVATTVSLAVGIGLRWRRRAIDALAPAAQFRLLLAAALAPGFAAAAVELGWMIDLHLLGCEHHHCAHHLAAPAAWSAVLAIGGLAVARLSVALLPLGRDLARALRVRAALEQVAARRDQMRVVPVDEPQAFVLGFVRPRTYVSRGLLALGGTCAEPVLAHERAHVRRRDPLWRLVASIGLAGHLPGIAAQLDRALARAQELAADAEAAGRLGDAPRLAEAIVRLARLGVGRPTPAVGWEGDTEDRVRSLLRDSTGPDWPRPAAMLGAAAGIALAAVLAADPLHHAAEAVLVLLAD